MTLATDDVIEIDPATTVYRPGDRFAIVTRDVLRKALLPIWDDNEDRAAASIQIMPDDRPMPDCGLLFIAIRPFETLLEGDDTYEKIGVGLKLAITLRTSDIAWDRSGINALIRSRYSQTSPKRVISWVASMVIQAMQINAATILRIANTAEEFENQPQLLHELSLALPNGLPPAREVTASHFLSSQRGASTRESVGLLQELTFDKGLWFHNLFAC
jgi:hypothetical protein